MALAAVSGGEPAATAAAVETPVPSIAVPTSIAGDSPIGLLIVKVSPALATPMVTVPVGVLCGEKAVAAVKVTVSLALPQMLLPPTFRKAPVPEMPEPDSTRFSLATL